MANGLKHLLTIGSIVCTNASFVAGYNYTSDGWDAGYGIALTNGVTLVRDLTRDFYRRSLITAITNSVGGTATAPLVYDYDKLNRVTSRNNDTFSYNARSEVTAASVQSNAYAYAYDHIGNHTASSVNADTTTYTANALNQYSQISVLSVPSVDNLIYDLDGNLLTNGVWSYAYDAENRLTSAYSNNVCVVSNAYDHMSRRVLKWTPCHTATFIYDGWNLVQETISTASSTTTNHYVWGKDLSGTMQGAGGVGGLLAVWMDETWHFPLYDANGNITAYADEQGVIVAEYVYDAYGGTIAKTGIMADAFTHRFSTKYYDAETGLYYYGYRFYDPVMHRWLNRDPIEEEGGLNLYAFCGNSGMNMFDVMGLRWLKHSYCSYDKAKGRIFMDGSRKSRKLVSCGYWDSINDLDIELDLDEYEKWLKPEDGKPLPASKFEQMNACRVFSIPNNVYIVVGWLEKGTDRMESYDYYISHGLFYWRYILSQKFQFQKQGLQVLVNKNADSDYIIQMLGDENIWGVSYFGHGGAWKVPSRSAKSGVAFLRAENAPQFIHHGLAFLFHQGCFGHTGMGDFGRLVSKNGEYRYHDGLISTSQSLSTKSRRGSYEP
jgi:RHS repeat-associated protein